MIAREPPRYPRVRVSIRSPNPLALVAAVREELRLAGAEHDEISRFTDQALERPEPQHVRAVAERWIGSVEAR